MSRKFITWKFAHGYTLISCIFMGFLSFWKDTFRPSFRDYRDVSRNVPKHTFFSVDKEITKATTEGTFFPSMPRFPEIWHADKWEQHQILSTSRPLDRVTTVPKTCQRRMRKYSWRTYWLAILSGKKVAWRLFTLDHPYFFSDQGPNWNVSEYQDDLAFWE